jgi:hypothetical protein
MKYETEYFKYDPPYAPGTLFFHDSIQSKYGLCPYIKLQLTFNDQEDSQLTEEVRQNRLKWLSQQSDGGALYFEMFKKIYQPDDHKTDLDAKSSMIENFLDVHLTDSQKELYQSSLEILDEYLKCQIKTKRIKDKYKLCIHNLSILFSETFLQIHEYLSIRFKHGIGINYINNHFEAKSYIPVFDTMLEEYKSVNDMILTKTKYNTNTKKNLKHELYMFFNKKATFKSEQSNKQTGQYFKKWSELTIVEQKERICSYLKWYISSEIAHLDQHKLEDVIVRASNDMGLKLEEKQLLNKDIKWNSKSGVIEKIKSFVFDKNTLTYSIQKVDAQSNKKTLYAINEKVVNEEILYWILKYVQTKDELTQEDKDKCLERVRSKLAVKKMYNKDKLMILNKIDEIFGIVKSNDM